MYILIKFVHVEYWLWLSTLSLTFFFSGTNLTRSTFTMLTHAACCVLCMNIGYTILYVFHPINFARFWATKKRVFRTVKHHLSYSWRQQCRKKKLKLIPISCANINDAMLAYRLIFSNVNHYFSTAKRLLAKINQFRPWQ